MARMRVILVLLVAIAAGGGLAYGTYSYVRNVPTAAAAVATRPVVVAAADIAIGAAAAETAVVLKCLTGAPSAAPAAKPVMVRSQLPHQRKPAFFSPSSI